MLFNDFEYESLSDEEIHNNKLKLQSEAQTHAKKRRVTILKERFCFDCEKNIKVRNPYSFRYHLRIKHACKTYICMRMLAENNMCFASFSEPKEIKDHRQKHTALVCPVCKIESLSEFALGLHIREKHLRDLFVCLVCYQTFSFESHLFEHVFFQHKQLIEKDA